MNLLNRDYNIGDRVQCNGYVGTVTARADWHMPDCDITMYTIRLPGGYTQQSASRLAPAGCARAD